MAGSEIWQRPIGESEILALFEKAGEIGLRLEMVGGGFTWEAQPGFAHQRALYAMQASVVPAPGEAGKGGCVQATDVAVSFGQGTVKRPDLAIWCREPAEREGIVREVPEAVIEITSPGYEGKDLIEGPQLYLRAGIKDVLVLDRRDGTVHHWTPSDHRTYTTPVTVQLVCGCRVTL